MVDKKKAVDGAIGGVLIAGAVAAKLAQWGLTVADTVFSGAVRMTDAFVKAPKLGLGFDKIPEKGAKECEDLSKKLWKKGMEMFR